jgi:hypothetical protein
LILPSWRGVKCSCVLWVPVNNVIVCCVLLDKICALQACYKLKASEFGPVDICLSHRTSVFPAQGWLVHRGPSALPRLRLLSLVEESTSLSLGMGSIPVEANLIFTIQFPSARRTAEGG